MTTPNCDLEYIHKKLMEIVLNSDNCPLCGSSIYAYYRQFFINRHLPFVEDHGDVIVGGIICGKSNGQRITLIQCRKSQSAGGTTRVYG